MPRLSETELLDWLQLIRTESIGPVTFHRLLRRAGSAAAAIERLPELARGAGRAGALIAADRAQCEAEMESLVRLGGRMIAACETDYPAPLAAIADPPPVLGAIGSTSLFERPAVAVIGARNASAIGRQFARQLAADLGRAGVVVVSGLARGIDAAAHAAALDAGTIAVVAGGLDVFYPSENESLAREIAARGLIVSERRLGHQPTARDFPRRNRLISGLSRGVVVVEAAERSGTLITARFALEQGREVFAVPGSPLDPRSHGAINLIREGATVIRNAEDILESLAEQTRHVRDGGEVDDAQWRESDWANGPKDSAASSALRAAVLELLSPAPLHRDSILREVDAAPGLIADALLDLVLAGEAEEHPGGRFSLAAREV